MIAKRLIIGVLFLTALIAGTLADVPRQTSPLQLGGYQVLAADFHIHSFPLSWATLTPWDTVRAARHEGLDVIAMTPQNHVWVAKVGRWFSERIGGPTVLVGEEIHSIRYHLLGVGIATRIGWNQTATGAIDEVHRQGGVAIAAHPTGDYWSGYDAEAMQKLDGAEVVHPSGLVREDAHAALREFYGRAHRTAVGDSDYHGLGPIGLCRTYVFARERTEKGILDALREGHTVVYDRGDVYGDPALIGLAAEDGRLPGLALTVPSTGFLSILSRVAALLGLIAVLIL
jgi:hypothetical protein